jgi:antitoxin ParD1/3/4
MPSAERRTIVLPADQAEYIDTLVATGAYASPSEVVKAGLEALQDRDESLDRWLREEVVPTYDAMQDEPGRGVSADELRAAISARGAAKSKATRRGT